MSVVNHDHSAMISFVGSTLQSAGECVCTLGVTTDNTDGQEVAGKAFAAWSLHVCPRISNKYTFRVAKVLIMLNGQVESWESFGEGEVTGGIGSNMLPSSVAVLVQKRTAFAGRRNRGRFYIPGVPAQDVGGTTAPNSLDASTLPSWQTNLDAFFAFLKGTTMGDPLDPVILHPSPSTPVTEVTAFSVQALLATQRGRMR